MSAAAPRVAMVGAGQLARMTHQAAIALGVELTVLAESPDAPAVRAGARWRAGAADDPAALAALLADHDVVTFDHEHAPADVLRSLAGSAGRIRPAPAAAELAQDKLHARRTLARLGFPVPRFASARTQADVAAFARHAGWPVVLKARRGGYDGRGVVVARDPDEAGLALRTFGTEACAEAHVPIATELAVLVARRPSGELAVYPVVETIQRDGMCRELVAPARIDAGLATRATDLALELAERIGAEGLLAVELFRRPDDALVVNELALRPHNTGHWTIEGAGTSQFEQHLRAVLDWPLGTTALRAPAAATVNVVGLDERDVAVALPAALAAPGAHVHLYGKAPRAGRKLGHVTALAATPDAALTTARAAASRLEQG